ncbi:hypothetical protein [Haloferula sp. BvORR071]|uniref:hypothetical protein n=1 Tax=Haloferula sp. BvORR071 TaxID=1396141 RepID=UPI002240F87B|nr:hypothetical protein [Haloferula sp. BvORR071]
MKTFVRFLLLLKVLCCGLAWGRDPAAVAEFEERLKQAQLPQDAQKLAVEAMASKDYDLIQACLNYPLASVMVMGCYVEEPASEFKDRLTMDLLAQQWEEKANEQGKEDPETYKPYVDYMRERLGEEVGIGSPEELMKAARTHDDRERLIRKFRNELVKAGLAESKAAASRPRKDWTPGHDPGSAAGDDADALGGGSNSTLLLVGAAVLIAAVGGYVLFSKKAA